VSTGYARVEENVGQSGACDSFRWDRGVLSAIHFRKDCRPLEYYPALSRDQTMSLWKIALHYHVNKWRRIKRRIERRIERGIERRIERTVVSSVESNVNVNAQTYETNKTH
jgi:hypothetical protein